MWVLQIDIQLVKKHERIEAKLAATKFQAGIRSKQEELEERRARKELRKVE